MIIERTDTEIIFRLPVTTDSDSLQRIINYLKFKEAVKTSSGNDEQANQLAQESKRRWWAENKSRFIK
jgi:hypothetical protein